MDEPAIPESLSEVSALIGDDATRILMAKLAGRTFVPAQMPRKLILWIGAARAALMVKEYGLTGLYFPNIRRYDRRALVISLQVKGLSASEAAEETGLTERRIYQIWATVK